MWCRGGAPPTLHRRQPRATSSRRGAASAARTACTSALPESGMARLLARSRLATAQRCRRARGRRPRGLRSATASRRARRVWRQNVHTTVDGHTARKPSRCSPPLARKPVEMQSVVVHRRPVRHTRCCSAMRCGPWDRRTSFPTGDPRVGSAVAVSMRLAWGRVPTQTISSTRWADRARAAIRCRCATMFRLAVHDCNPRSIPRRAARVAARRRPGSARQEACRELRARE